MKVIKIPAVAYPHNRMNLFFLGEAELKTNDIFYIKNEFSSNALSSIEELSNQYDTLGRVQISSVIIEDYQSICSILGYIPKLPIGTDFDSKYTIAKAIKIAE